MKETAIWLPDAHGNIIRKDNLICKRSEVAVKKSITDKHYQLWAKREKILSILLVTKVKEEENPSATVSLDRADSLFPRHFMN